MNTKGLDSKAEMAQKVRQMQQEENEPGIMEKVEDELKKRGEL